MFFCWFVLLTMFKSTCVYVIHPESNAEYPDIEEHRQVPKHWKPGPNDSVSAMECFVLMDGEKKDFVPQILSCLEKKMPLHKLIFKSAFSQLKKTEIPTVMELDTGYFRHDLSFKNFCIDPAV